MSPGQPLQSQSQTQGSNAASPDSRPRSRARLSGRPNSFCFVITPGTPRHGTSSSPRTGGAHGDCRLLLDRLGRFTAGEFLERRTLADLAFINNGITFSVYSDRRGTEKIFPFDLIPRPVSGHEWDRLEAGLVQRIRALNLFLDDVYHDQRILKEGVIPSNLVLASKGFRSEMIGFNPPGKQYLHVVGTDLIRDPSGEFLVLEDNGRSPSGVSYVIENRVVMKKVFPQLFQQCRVRRVEDYPRHLWEALSSVAPPGAEDPPMHRAPVARAVQLRLLRALLPGPAHGDRAGVRAGPVC